MAAVAANREKKQRMTAAGGREHRKSGRQRHVHVAWAGAVSATLLAGCGNHSTSTVSPSLSTVAIAPTDGLLANGVAAAEIVVSVLTATGAPVPGVQTNILVDGADNVLRQPLPTDGTGRAAGTLATLRAETKTVTIRVVQGATVFELAARPTVRFVGDPATLSALRSSLTAMPSSGVPADGLSTAQVVVRVADALGNPVAGQAVRLAAAGGDTIVVQPSASDASGLATGAIAATIAGTKTVTATINPGPGEIVVAQQAPIAFVGAASALSGALSEVIAGPANVLANGTAVAQVTVTLRDARGNLVPGVPVTLASSGSQNTLTQPGTSNAFGIATGVLASTRAESKTITATALPSGLMPVELTQQPSITFVADPLLLSAALSTVTATPPWGVAADGTSSVAVAIMLQDALGNRLAGLTPVLSATGISNVVGAPGATALDGTSNGTLATTRAETKTVRVTVNPGNGPVTLLQQPVARFAWPLPSTYYVRVSGSDTAAGTSPATAWRSLARAATGLASGATVHVGAGTYAERVVITASGSAGSPIRWIADRGGSHTGDAGDVIVDAAGAAEAFCIDRAAWVEISGFTIRGATAALSGGVRVTGSNVTLRGCRIWGNVNGVWVQGEAAWFHPAWSHRRRITFGTSHALLPRGFTTSFPIDTRVASTPVALANGDDVRVVWQPTAGPMVEIDRIGDAFDAAATRIEFRLQSDLPANADEDSDGAYFVYYGNAAASVPPRAEGNVYFFADFFGRSDGTTIGNGWTEWNNAGDMALLNGALVIKPTGDANPPQVGIKQSLPLGAIPGDFRVTFTWNMPPNDEATWSFWGMNVGNAAVMTNSDRKAGVGPALYNAEALGTTGVEVIDNDMAGNLETNINGLHTFRADVWRTGQTFDYWRGGVQRATGVAWANNIATLDAYRIGADNFGFAPGEEQTIDDVKIVLLVSDDPETSAATEQAMSSAMGADAVVEGCSISANLGGGVVVRRADRTIVRGCLIYANLGHGIDVGESAQAAVLAGNTLDRSLGSQVRVDGSGCTATLRDNLATGGPGAGFAVEAGASVVTSDHNDAFGNAANWSGLALGVGDFSADPRYLDPDGTDNLLGGAGGADDLYHLGTAPISAAFDAGAAAAAATTWADGSPQAERSTRIDATLDGTGPDGTIVNLGFHYDATVDALPLRSANDLRAMYGVGNDRQVRVHRRDGATQTWSSPARALPAGGGVRWVEAAASPATDHEEVALVLVDTGGGASLDAMRFDGTAWHRDFRETSVPSAAEPGSALAYEQASGDALCVFAVGSANPRWRARSGGVWSASAPVFASPPGGVVQQVLLVAKPSSDEVALVFADVAGALHAIVWTGTAWDEAGSATTLSNGIVAVTGTRCFDVAYEALSGDLLVAWGDPSPSEVLGWAARPAGGPWTLGTLAPAYARGRVVRLAAEPGANRIAAVLAEASGEGDVAGAVWDGTTWSAAAELDASASTNALDAAVGWRQGVAVIVYRDDDGGGALDWATWTPSGGFVGQPDAPLAGAGDTQHVRLHSVPSGALVALLADDGAQLWAMAFDGAGWSVENSGAALTATLSSTATLPFWVW